MKKSLGQNFLTDPNILQKIAEKASITEGDVVVEVGPGLGTLTKFLLEKAQKVIAIEKDEELAESLEKNEKLEVIKGDVLEIDPKILPKNYILVGNIPYYITGALFKKFLESENQPRSITFVVQKEVAERILAEDKKESILSISIKAYGEPELGGVIKAGSFSPAPKVDSQIISIRKISKEKFKEANIQEKDFFDVVKRGFAHKRKLLRRNLGLETGILESIGLNEDVRAEDLTTGQWFDIIKLWKTLGKTSDQVKK